MLVLWNFHFFFNWSVTIYGSEFCCQNEIEVKKVMLLSWRSSSLSQSNTHTLFIFVCIKWLYCTNLTFSFIEGYLFLVPEHSSETFSRHILSISAQKKQFLECFITHSRIAWGWRCMCFGFSQCMPSKSIKYCGESNFPEAVRTVSAREI